MVVVQHHIVRLVWSMSVLPTAFAFWNLPHPYNSWLATHPWRTPIVWAQQPNNQHSLEQPQILIVGKVIVDEYGPPHTQPNITVGGGGPQAAMGAALALAARDWQKQQPDKTTTTKPPPPQPITFVGPVGDLDFSEFEAQALLDMLQPALQNRPRLLRGDKLFTPRIRLWHDQQQVLQWYPLNDSFGKGGADGLWSILPSINDYLEILDELTSSVQKPILHIITEAGKNAPGNQGDSRPLLDTRLRDKISFVGVEPILFPNDQGVVSEGDATHCAKLMQQILEAIPTTNEPSVVFSPDMAAYQAMVRADCLPASPCLDSWAIRNGPQGSQLVTAAKNEATTIPVATLRQLVNPTGAGNAYSAAYTTLRGCGCSALESACLASGVGAVFCEYAHCPPYTWEVIQRVAQASQQVQTRVHEQLVQHSDS